MLHGWGVNSAAFAPLYDHLSEYRVYYVDLPGFGFSQPADNSLKAWATQLAKQLPRGAFWAGWSLGGLVATRVALDFPEHVRGLVTIASSPCFMAREEEGWFGIPHQVLGQFSEQLGKNLPKTIARFLAIQAMGSATAKEDIKRIRELVLARPLPQSDALAAGLTMLAQEDLRPELDAINLPWLRIWGRLDSLVPKPVITAMPTTPASENMVIAKASHAPFISHTEEFVGGLLGWLDKVCRQP
ncbi:MAG: pimeloyl-ACP methyl ester esterase BioH [Shewanella sp.]|nr:pimeloyl-ACP methyl ester esterase BioH [Shewanella sp.]MCF1430280.1 pimeloyl-ACP methyl ester esterase BioH [Shewanella sp.]MCF1438998.1 pimeloyl-ACP methyl ester esterase BioH [Shewanella sp.]MCF1458447.1 pimeloyl-ACP methyl ester esterase BioH [Shewanella sp.]